MRNYNGEEILVIPRALFDELGSFQGIQTDVVRYLEAILDPANNFFMDRANAEEDPSHKQIIPYAIFHHEGRYLHYTRGKSGGESRLHAQGSVGIGGHINPVDERADPLGRKTYLAGVEREIEEELKINGSHKNRIVALLNDDSNEVGAVHLGVVHIFDLDTDEGEFRRRRTRQSSLPNKRRSQRRTSREFGNLVEVLRRHPDLATI